MVAVCEAWRVSSATFSKVRGGAVLKTRTTGKNMTAHRRNRVYKKDNVFVRFFGGMKVFFKSYFSSLINPTFEKELMTGNRGSAAGVAGPASDLNAGKARRKRVGGRRVGSISDLAPEPSSCGA